MFCWYSVVGAKKKQGSLTLLYEDGLQQTAAQVLPGLGAIPRFIMLHGASMFVVARQASVSSLSLTKAVASAFPALPGRR